jgi:hypothetical protein
MNNRKRANQITLGIFSILLGAIILTIAFPKIILTSILIIGSLVAIYHIGKAIRGVIEENLDEQDRINKWKQEKNIK